MKKFFLSIILVTTLACSNNEKKPEEIMTKKQMVDFLIDLHIIEARLNITRMANDSVKLFFREVEDSLYRKHQISDSVYLKSYQYYLDHVNDMEEIYEAVVDSLSVRERMLKTN